MDPSPGSYVQPVDVVTTGERPDLDQQAREAFRQRWPEFIFHDAVSAAHIERVETYFPQFDVLVLDEGRVVAGGWGVPMRWDGTLADLPAGYSQASTSSPMRWAHYASIASRMTATSCWSPCATSSRGRS